MSDLFFGQLSDLWHYLFSPHRLLVVYPPLSILVQQTWPIAVIGWIGVRLLVRPTGKALRLRSAVLLFGTVWAFALFMYSRLALEGSAIVHDLSFSLLVVGGIARFVSTVVSGSNNRSAWRT